MSVAGFCLGLLVWGSSNSSVAGFVAKSGLLRPAEATTKNNVMSPTPFFPTKPDDRAHSTPLHVGVSYGPPVFLDASQENGLQQRGTTTRQYSYNMNTNSNYPFFDVDPAFRAVSIAYPVQGQQEELRQRKWKKALAGSTAVVCAALLAQRIPALLAHLPYLYKAYPLKAAIATCGLNSAVADSLSQVQSNKGKDVFAFEWRQHLSGIFYGAFILGIGSNLVYTKLLPALCPGTGIKAILSQASLDNFVFAPLLWLPPAYMIKAVFLQQPVMKALRNYVKAVREEKLLLRYWSMWLPAQLFTFSVVPKHLRVVSTAAFGFVWFLILTNMTSKKTSSSSS